MGFPGGSAVKNSPEIQELQRCGFNAYIRKTPWRRSGQSTAAVLIRESHGQGIWWATVNKVAKGWT